MKRVARLVLALAMLATGTVIGAVAQRLVTAEIGAGERAVFVPLPTPCRLVDTRLGGTIGPKASPLGPGEVYEIRGRPPGATGACSAIPPTAQTLSLNVTALDATEPTFLTIWPEGPLPLASSLNPAPGQPPTPNAVKVTLSGAGTFHVFNDRGEVNVIVDVDGYFEHHNHDDRSGVEFSKGDSLVRLTVAPKVVASIVLNPPDAGYAIVTASGYFNFSSHGEDIVRCSITAGAGVINLGQLIIASAPSDSPSVIAPDTFQSFSSTVVHPVGAGATTFNLVCEKQAGSQVWVGDVSLTAHYVPTRM